MVRRVGFVVALVAAVTAPLLQLAGVVSPLDVLHAPWIQAAGITVAAAGIATTVHAQLDMGDSWHRRRSQRDHHAGPHRGVRLGA